VIEQPILHPLVTHPDSRGNVREAYRESWFPDLPPVRQIVRSQSRPGTMRAMHAHKRQYDVWHVVSGKMQVQLYDHRDGDWQTHHLDAGHTLVIPPGVSHGFYTALGCLLTYFLTEEYDGTDEFGWDAYDPAFPGANAWPISDHLALRSERDRNAPSLAAFKEAW
jgi:dTDP-4-dehydrorhamnose 3,5-epimerase-like enzyme